MEDSEMTPLAAALDRRLEETETAYLFEIGGAGKKFGQIKDIADSFVAADGMETGVGNKIPLWLFGFLY